MPNRMVAFGITIFSPDTDGIGPPAGGGTGGAMPIAGVTGAYTGGGGAVSAGGGAIGAGSAEGGGPGGAAGGAPAGAWAFATPLETYDMSASKIDADDPTLPSWPYRRRRIRTSLGFLGESRLTRRRRALAPLPSSAL